MIGAAERYAQASTLLYEIQSMAFEWSADGSSGPFADLTATGIGNTET